MSYKTAFARAIDSQFTRLGQQATYVHTDGRRQTLSVMARRPEQLFALGEGDIHAEQPQLAFRASDAIKPRTGDYLVVEDSTYRIVAEPCLDLHHLLWFVDCLCESPC